MNNKTEICPGCFRCREEFESYGFFCGEDPRDFIPDPECSTDEERARHAEDCARWDNGDFLVQLHSGLEYIPTGMYKHNDGTPNAAGFGFVERSPYGLGTWQKNSKNPCDGSGVIPAEKAN